VLYRTGVALIGPTQRLLRRDLQFRQQAAHRGQSQRLTHSLLDQVRDDAPRPQTEVKPVLPGVFAADPLPHLPLLLVGKLARPAGVLARRQSGLAAFGFRPQPAIDRRAAQSITANDLARPLAFADASNRHSSNAFRNLVTECASIDYHTPSIAQKSKMCSLNYGLISKPTA